MNPKLIFIYFLFALFLITVGLTHINEDFIFLVLIIMGFIWGFMANESFFKESKLDSKLNDYKKYAITEGDMLSNIRTTDSYREVPSGPPPSLTTTKPLNNEWTVCCSGINYDVLKIKNGWDYRIVKNTAVRDYLDNSISTYGIHQVYVDKNGDTVRIEENPASIFDESVDKLKETIGKIQNCLNKPVIDFITGEEIE